MQDNTGKQSDSLNQPLDEGLLLTEMETLNIVASDQEETGSWLNELSILIRHIQEDTAKAQLLKVQPEITELTRKGESLCCQNGNLLIEQHDLKAEIAKLQAEVIELRERVLAWENLEASVCPEDIGLVEYITALKNANLSRINDTVAKAKAEERKNVLKDVYKWLNTCGYKKVAAGLRHYYKSKLKSGQKPQEGE